MPTMLFNGYMLTGHPLGLQWIRPWEWWDEQGNSKHEASLERFSSSGNPSLQGHLQLSLKEEGSRPSLESIPIQNSFFGSLSC